ncbi:hypothetical protein COCVIDRAFT_19072 [Bipolaris victoriae FI3]|uniref:Ribosomal protein L22 n=1 Tax=Bipolaris victoriae (strain FI3) TaxID=930091 RepID=W7EGQ4_BIPV3|nr:hypothetical protein COCVIDRAFT_19072 [Bipolaris victoriae FI3]
MSARVPPRRLAQSALAALRPRTHWVSSTSLPCISRRNASSGGSGNDEDLTNPILDQYLRKKELESGAVDGGRSVRPTPRFGGLSNHPSSLFLPEREIPGWRDDLSATEKEKLQARYRRRQEQAKQQEERELMNMNIDPDQTARKRLERKLVISGVKRHGRMTKSQKLLRTERQSLYKSHNLPTSTKKLQKVVNQIAGKTVSEALVQLRFSKKRIARDVIKGLEIAQNRAIVGHGMGLAGEAAAVSRWNKQREATDAGKPKDTWDYKTSSDDSGIEVTKPKVPFFKDTTIELKDGRKKVVRDPSEIYIDQAWVGPGESWKSPEFRARGAINMLKHRTTSFSVLLKEEKTRMRISDEIKKKRENRKVWVALPDRPITSQRQFCLW